MTYITNGTNSTSSTVQWAAGTTAMTAPTHYTIQIPPGTRQINVPIYQPVTLRCDHIGRMNWRTQTCDGCGQTAEAIQKAIDFEASIQKRMAPPLNFNKYINASDLLEEFIQYLGEHKVKQGEVYQLPMDLFIKWLIIRACEEDKEEPNAILQLPAPKSQPRCMGCQKFMPKGTEFMIHSGMCADLYFKREKIMSNG